MQYLKSFCEVTKIVEVLYQSPQFYIQEEKLYVHFNGNIIFYLFFKKNIFYLFLRRTERE